MKNNNSKAVRRLSTRSLKSNRARNIFALIAIVLTTFMILTVFSIGVSFGKNMSVMTKRLAGTMANITLTHPSEENVEYAKALYGVKSLGKQYSVGSARGKTEYGKDLSISILAYDNDEWEKHTSPCVADINGTFPKNENEIMLSKKSLDQLSVTQPELGMTINLTYRSKGETLTRDFILTGWFTEYDSTRSSGLALLSEKYAESSGLTLKDNGRITICASRSSADDIYSALLEKIGEKNRKDLSSSFSTETSSAQGTIIIAVTIIIIAMFIVFSGYLLIYNIMYISVKKDIHFYGMLKTIGTSPKQIRKIVFRQGILLSVIGIPVGLVLGLATSFGIVPYFFKAMESDSLNSSAMPSEISFSPLIVIGTVIFSLLTIAISCRKPAKLACRVSPVEAVKYSGSAERTRNKDKRTAKGSVISDMAFHNVFRDRKRAFIVFTSLFMGTITFLSVNSVFSSLDVNNYIARYHENDFSYTSTPPITEVKFDSDFINELKNMDGITDMQIVTSDYVNMPFDEEKFKPVLERTIETYGDEIGTYEELLFAIKKMSAASGYGTWAVALPEQYTKSIKDFDIEAFRRGETCIVGYGEYEDMIGKTIELKSEKTGKTKQVTIAGCLTNSEDFDFARFSYTVGTLAAVFVSDDCLKELNTSPVVTNITIDVTKRAEPAVKARLKELNASLVNKTFIFDSRSDAAEDFSASMRTMSILMDSIAVLLILIGIINFINVMTTGVFTRRRELAMLESVGMTKKQIYKMLCMEGGFYALITDILILIPGSLIMLLIGKAMPFIADYAKFSYPFLTVILLLIAIIIICIFIPPLVYKFTAVESVTERLHSTES